MRESTRARARARAASGGSRRRGVSAVLAVAAAGLVLASAGCSLQDAICGGEEYPVLHVGSTGRACVPKSEEPPKGYARFPEGKVPQHVDDEWDTYWQSRTLDKDGKIIEVSAG
ncbi:SCO0607 family lipoprotein (plasmid) [Streptomyces sp. CA-294286]|uniref:SCO0607 family lipoprotein n=1 Tax=Streptomyces sp. CA-294286 TaxID=3240070 RepID=UPI003D902969